MQERYYIRTKYSYTSIPFNNRYKSIICIKENIIKCISINNHLGTKTNFLGNKIELEATKI